MADFPRFLVGAAAGKRLRASGSCLCAGLHGGYGGLPNHFHDPAGRGGGDRHVGCGPALPAGHRRAGPETEGDPGQGRRATLLLVLFSLAALGLGLGLGWKALGPRLGRIEMREGFEGRQETYDRAKPMAKDYPVFGTGPGTFGTVFQFYRKPTEAQWSVQLHDDWLETRITFGWVGCGLIGLAFVTVILRWFGRGGIHGSRRFMVLMWLSLAGCLTQARWDFPFQIYSIVFLALVLCAIAANLTRRGA